MTLHIFILSYLIFLPATWANNQTEATQTDCLRCGTNNISNSIDDLFNIKVKISGFRAPTTSFIEPNKVFTPINYTNDDISKTQCDEIKARIERLSLEKAIPYHQFGSKNASSGFYDYRLRPYQNVIESLIEKHGNKSADCLAQVKQKISEVAKKNKYAHEHGRITKIFTKNNKKFEISVLTYSGLDESDVSALSGFVDLVTTELSAKNDSPLNTLDFALNGKPIYIPYADIPSNKTRVVKDIREEFLPPYTYLKYPLNHIIRSNGEKPPTELEIESLKESWISAEVSRCKGLAAKKLPSYNCSQQDLSKTVWIDSSN